MTVALCYRCLYKCPSSSTYSGERPSSRASSTTHTLQASTAINALWLPHTAPDYSSGSAAIPTSDPLLQSLSEDSAPLKELRAEWMWSVNKVVRHICKKEGLPVFREIRKIHDKRVKREKEKEKKEKEERKEEAKDQQVDTFSAQLRINGKTNNSLGKRRDKNDAHSIAVPYGKKREKMRPEKGSKEEQLVVELRNITEKRTVQSERTHTATLLNETSQIKPVDGSSVMMPFQEVEERKEQLKDKEEQELQEPHEENKQPKKDERNKASHHRVHKAKNDDKRKRNKAEATGHHETEQGRNQRKEKERKKKKREKKSKEKEVPPYGPPAPPLPTLRNSLVDVEAESIRMPSALGTNVAQRQSADLFDPEGMTGFDIKLEDKQLSSAFSLLPDGQSMRVAKNTFGNDAVYNAEAEFSSDDEPEDDHIATSWTLPAHFAPALIMTRVGETKVLRLDGWNKTVDPSLLELRRRYQFGVEPCASLIVLQAYGYAIWVRQQRPSFLSWATALIKQE